MTRHELVDDLVAVLSEQPGSSARELVALLRRRGVRADKSRVNSVLYSHSEFASDGSVPPLWSLAAVAPPEALRLEHRVTGLAVSNWKAFETAILEVGPITLLYGENSSGKSSLIQALLLMQQSWGRPDLMYEQAGGRSFDFHSRVVHRHDAQRQLTLTALWGDLAVRLAASTDEAWAHGPAQPLDLIVFDVGDGVLAAAPVVKKHSRSPHQWMILRRDGPSREGSVGPPDQHALVGVDQHGFPDLAAVVSESEGARRTRMLEQAGAIFDGAAQLLSGVAHIGPVRAVPERDLTLGAARTAAPYVVRLFQSDALRDDVNLWLSKFEIPYEVEVDLYGGDGDDEEFGLALRHMGGGERVQLPDVGFGVSQLLPLVVQLIASREQTILIEEPEAHVHPRLQSVLADLFVESMQDYGNVLLVETHSEPILLRLQRRVAEQRITSDDVSIVHVVRDGVASRLEQVEVKEDGQLDYQWPGGFFDNRMDDLVAILDPRMGG